MKVIRKDNYDRETRSEQLVAENLNEASARNLADELNAKLDPYGDDFFAVVTDDYKLFVFRP